jgi:hypothetical protein
MMSAPRSVCRLLVGLAIAALFFPIHLPGQSTIQVRPYTHEPPTGTLFSFTNPDWAYDASTISVAGAAATNHCHIACLVPTVISSTWSFPSGYIEPARLVVRWYASASFFHGPGATGKVEAKVEYSLNGGGSWSLLEEFVDDAAPNSTLQMHDKELPLSSSLGIALLKVRGTLTVRMTGCPEPCASSVYHTTGAMQIGDIRVDVTDCHVPTGETTTGMGWSQVPGLATAHEWRQVLLPASSGISFNGRKVTEEDPGGGGPDTCHFPQSQYAKEEKISGGTWLVGSANQWGDDTVGWLESRVTYYRAQGQEPCQTEFPQRMVINCGTGKRTYVTNVLRMGFDTVNAWSERAGQYASRVWP